MHGLPLLCQASSNPCALILTVHIQDSMRPCAHVLHKTRHLLFIHLNDKTTMHKHTWVHLPMQVKSIASGGGGVLFHHTYFRLSSTLYGHHRFRTILELLL